MGGRVSASRPQRRLAAGAGGDGRRRAGSRARRPAGRQRPRRLRLLKGLTGSINLEVGKRAAKIAGMKVHYATFASYNAWVNRPLYDRAAQLSADTVRPHPGRSFQSLYPRLNTTAP